MFVCIDVLVISMPNLKILGWQLQRNYSENINVKHFPAISQIWNSIFSLKIFFPSITSILTCKIKLFFLLIMFQKQYIINHLNTPSTSLKYIAHCAKVENSSHGTGKVVFSLYCTLLTRSPLQRCIAQRRFTSPSPKVIARDCNVFPVVTQ